MLPDLTTWIEKIRTALRPPNEPDDRLPSEHVIESLSLRGYRGPAMLVSARPYPSAVRLDGFVDRYVKDLAARGWPLSKELVERDVLALEGLCDVADAVHVVGAN
jgi:hypothetical protein